MYTIVFYVPESHLEVVKHALFASGAGRVGQYDCCCWQTLGVGQYRPLPGSQPYYGKINEVACVDEYRVEMDCEKPFLKAAIAALLATHPYEVPAYSVYELSAVMESGC